MVWVIYTCSLLFLFALALPFVLSVPDSFFPPVCRPFSRLAFDSHRTPALFCGPLRTSSHFWLQAIGSHLIQLIFDIIILEADRVAYSSEEDCRNFISHFKRKMLLYKNLYLKKLFIYNLQCWWPILWICITYNPTVISAYFNSNTMIIAQAYVRIIPRTTMM